jgi:RNA polymerase sigma-70 factor (ECF subfamily)
LASAAGDRAAFRALYDATSPLLFPAALRMLRRRDAAEDALQETYLRVWTRAGSYQPERGPPLPWLFRILRNLVYDRIAAEQSRPTADLGDHVEAIAAPQRPPEVALDLAAGMARLSLFQGASASEIAARLEVPLGTAKCWLRRGLQRLRLEMAG